MLASSCGAGMGSASMRRMKGQAGQIIDSEVCGELPQVEEDMMSETAEREPGSVIVTSWWSLARERFIPSDLRAFLRSLFLGEPFKPKVKERGSLPEAQRTDPSKEHWIYYYGICVQYIALPLPQNPACGGRSRCSTRYLRQQLD